MINRREMLKVSALFGAGIATSATAITIPPVKKGSKSVKGTKTELNLLRAFAGESQARNKYTCFAQIAEQEGFLQIAQIFIETAEQEKIHAMRLFSCLESGDALNVDYSFPAGKIGTTAQNLVAAAAGEKAEWSGMYPEFEKIAREEGLPQIANLFKMIARAEVHHEKRYHEMSKRLAKGFFTSDDDDEEWECPICGYVHTGSSAPMTCPACGVPQTAFREKIDY